MNSSLITSALKMEKWQLHEQEDADEFYLKIVDKLSQQPDQNQLKLYKKTFEGQKETINICPICKAKTKQDNQFVNIVIPMYEHFSQSMQKLFEEEIIEGCVCDKCKKQIDKHQINNYKSLPDVLDFTLQRFQYDQYYNLSKNQNDIVMPIMLDLTFIDIRQHYPKYDDQSQEQQYIILKMLFMPWLYFQVTEENEISLSDFCLQQLSDPIIQENVLQASSFINENQRFQSHFKTYYQNIQLECYLNVASCNILDGWMPNNVFKQQEFPKDLYIMRMIVHHAGTALGGHYYISDLELCDNQISCVTMNDLNISSVDDENLLEQIGYQKQNNFYSSLDTPYMYFYERLNNVMNYQRYFIAYEDQPEIQEMKQQYKSSYQNILNIQFMTNVKDGKTQIFGDDTKYTQQINRFCTVNELIQKVLQRQEFQNIKPDNYKIYAVRYLSDNFYARHYKIFDKNENNELKANIYHLAILSQQLNQTDIKLYIEFNVNGQNDQYDENKQYIKVQKVNQEQCDYNMFNDDKHVNKNQIIKFQKEFQYISVDKQQELQKQDVLEIIARQIDQNVKQLFGKTWQYPYIEQINQEIDSSYSIIYYSSDDQQLNIERFTKMVLYNEDQMIKEFYVPNSLSIEQIKEQIVQQYNLFDIQQVNVSPALTSEQQRQQIEQLHYNRPETIKFTIVQSIEFQYQNQFINYQIEQQPRNIQEILQQITNAKDIQFRLQYNVSRNKYQEQFAEIENIENMNQFQLIQYKQPFYILQQVKFQQILAQIYIQCELDDERKQLSNLCIKDKNKKYQQLVDYVDIYMKNQQIDGQTYKIEKVEVCDGTIKEVKLDQKILETPFNQDNIQITFYATIDY